MGKSLKPSHKDRYQQLQSLLRRLPWILNGSVMKIAPRSCSPNANTTYTWTRKVKGKTVTVALSKQQYAAFRHAIKANRQLERTLKQMRQISETVLLDSLPGVRRKPRLPNTKKTPPHSS
jgi:hypothetical protein